MKMCMYIPYQYIRKIILNTVNTYVKLTQPLTANATIIINTNIRHFRKY